MSEPLKIQTAAQGHGPLWQRDYWCEIEDSSLSPQELIDLVRKDFPTFSPESLAAFEMKQQRPLEVGDEMSVAITGVGEAEVRCVHRDDLSFTLRTLQNHPEAGRITFCSYSEDGKLIFRVRSRARSIDRVRSFGFKAGAHMMQAQTWVQFVEHAAEKSGGRIVEAVRTSTVEVQATMADRDELDTPTFIAKDKDVATGTDSDLEISQL